jgi:membrane-bound lytic murein transglycosylase MltF
MHGLGIIFIKIFLCRRLILPTFVLVGLWIGPAIVRAEDAKPAFTLPEPWTGDFDGMAERGMIRVLVVYSRTHFFLDGAQQRGMTYEQLRHFEAEINSGAKGRKARIDVVAIPVARDELLPALIEGRGDIAAASLTVTPQRAKQVDFADPFATDVRETVVTGPASRPVTGLDDLAGREIVVRASSSYFESLTALNRDFVGRGLPPVEIIPTDEHLEDEDLLEMVNAGLIPMVVVDDDTAQFWAQVLPDIRVYEDIVVRTDAAVAWAIRRNSPKLRAVIDSFVEENRKGSETYNVLARRYFRENRWVRNAFATEDLKRFRQAERFFRKYGSQYGFDWLMIAAQAYQESRLDQRMRSRRGAVGIMQILPSTAAGPDVGIRNINRLADNIHAGTKYLRFVADTYFPKDMDPMNRLLFAFASYNCGPSRIAQLRRQASAIGLDGNKWFRHVELLAAREVGVEPVQYVRNIYKYYIAYKLAAEKLERREAARVQTQEEAREDDGLDDH